MGSIEGVGLTSNDDSNGDREIINTYVEYIAGVLQLLIFTLVPTNQTSPSLPFAFEQLLLSIGQ